jgi:hypothetical protein
LYPCSQIKGEKEEAEKLGFRKAKYNKLTLQIELNGIRYLAGQIKIPEDQTKLMSEYNISVELSEVSSSTRLIAKSTRILLTPIALVGDGAFTIGMIPIYAVHLMLHKPRLGSMR